MSSKIDLVVYEQGERRVIGEAVVDVTSDGMAVSGVVTDPYYQIRMHENATLSFSFSPTLNEAAILPPLQLQGHIPNS